MGAGTSSAENVVGDEVFKFAESSLQIEDVEKLEKITGMVLAGSEISEVESLLLHNQKELKRRLKESVRLIEKNGRQPSNQASRTTCGIVIEKTAEPKVIKNVKDIEVKKEELVQQLERLNPGVDSARVSDELLKLSGQELSLVMSSPSEFKSFIQVCSAEDESCGNIKKGPTSFLLDSNELIEKVKQEQLELLSKQDLNEDDINSLIGNHLFNRVNELHPSQAELLTGILMGLEKDKVLQLLISAPILHQNLSSVINELQNNGKLNERNLIVMREELGEVIYSLHEKDMDQETASHVTGMFMLLDIVLLHEILADDYLFHKRTNEALNAAKVSSK